MNIPEISNQNITDAIRYIDENGIPPHNQSTKYFLIVNDKKYPPKYVIAVANHLATGENINSDGYNSVDAKRYFETQGYTVKINETTYKLTITAETVTSTDERFSINDLGRGDDYETLDVYFQNVNGDIIRRNYMKREVKLCNKTMPKLAFQIFEKQLTELSSAEKENFPTCQYSSDSDVIRGIFQSTEEIKKRRNSNACMEYITSENQQMVIYCWNIFSTIMFVQECLKRFGEQGDQFVVIYHYKEKKEKMVETETTVEEVPVQQLNEYINKYSYMLVKSKNIILRGAPGTGKSHLAKKIAADIISNGYSDDYTSLTDEQKKQVEFVQFHPSYDYSDFVEGLRPKLNPDGSMGFELQSGVFTRFITRARKNYENSQKSTEIIEKEITAQESMSEFFDSIELVTDKFKTIKGSEFSVTSVDERHICIAIPGNESINKISLNTNELRRMLESDKDFNKITDVTSFFGKQYATQGYSYDFALYKEIKKKQKKISKTETKSEKLKQYIFIIDEINRGEISKIFGELFFSIDPGYRGHSGEVSTQYANMHSDPEDKFFIPENVYIIGTMNDIDRSVDSFDFAMRRRFRFVEIKADDRLEMLDSLKDEYLKNEAIKRMTSLNKAILTVDDLNENYQIGASYFLKLKYMDFDELWTDCLYPLLQDYVRGMYDETGIISRFAKAYGYKRVDNSDESAHN